MYFVKITGERSYPEPITLPCWREGFFGIENDCTRYYRCIRNTRGLTKVDFSCGLGTFWDPEINTCVHKREDAHREDCDRSYHFGRNPNYANEKDSSSYYSSRNPNDANEKDSSRYYFSKNPNYATEKDSSQWKVTYEKLN